MEVEVEVEVGVGVAWLRMVRVGWEEWVVPAWKQAAEQAEMPHLSRREEEATSQEKGRPAIEATRWVRAPRRIASCAWRRVLTTSRGFTTTPAIAEAPVAAIRRWGRGADSWPVGVDSEGEEGEEGGGGGADFFGGSASEPYKNIVRR